MRKTARVVPERESHMKARRPLKDARDIANQIKKEERKKEPCPHHLFFWLKVREIITAHDEIPEWAETLRTEADVKIGELRTESEQHEQMLDELKKNWGTCNNA